MGVYILRKIYCCRARNWGCKTPHKKRVIAHHLIYKDEALNGTAHRDVIPWDFKLLVLVRSDHNTNVFCLGIQEVGSELEVNVSGADMVLEELVYEGHKVSLHGISYLEVVCLDRGHHVLNHLDDFSAESHCSLVVWYGMQQKNFFYSLFVDMSFDPVRNLLFDHGDDSVIF